MKVNMIQEKTCINNELSKTSKCQILVYGAALFCQERGPEPTQFGLGRDQVFRLQICLLLENYYISCLLHLGRHQDLNMFQIFSGP